MKLFSWDDWVFEARLRKLTDENKELAQNLKKDLDAQRKPATAKANMMASKKKAAGSDLSSGRGSEERNSSVPAMGRGQKRGRDYDLEKVNQDVISVLISQEAAGGPRRSARESKKRRLFDESIEGLPTGQLAGVSPDWAEDASLKEKPVSLKPRKPRISKEPVSASPDKVVRPEAAYPVAPAVLRDATIFTVGPDPTIPKAGIPAVLHQSTSSERGSTRNISTDELSDLLERTPLL